MRKQTARNSPANSPLPTARSVTITDQISTRNDSMRNRRTVLRINGGGPPEDRAKWGSSPKASTSWQPNNKDLELEFEELAQPMRPRRYQNQPKNLKLPQQVMLRDH